MSKADPTSEEFVWPEVNELRPSDAARLLYEVEAEATKANAKAELMKRRKAEAKQIVLAVRDIYDQPDVSADTPDGRRVRYTPYEHDFFSVDNPEQFKAWAATQNEAYYETLNRLRDQLFQDEMRRRQNDGEPLPPGVRKYTDTRLSRSSAKR